LREPLKSREEQKVSAESELINVAATIALTHHERYDGTGYPQGLAGDDIPLEGRIVAVADAFDALLSDRCYRPALPPDETIAVIEEERGTLRPPDRRCPARSPRGGTFSPWPIHWRSDLADARRLGDRVRGNSPRH
jgi:HD domain